MTNLLISLPLSLLVYFSPPTHPPTYLLIPLLFLERCTSLLFGDLTANRSLVSMKFRLVSFYFHYYGLERARKATGARGSQVKSEATATATGYFWVVGMLNAGLGCYLLLGGW
ncbi:hypothetical protein BDW68DRAFT_10446 [Aspergillus falconensis]